MNNSKFIVITSINNPTVAIKKFARWKNWKVAVVGDKKTPKDWSYNHVEYLSINTQKELFPKMFNLIPFNSYKRKIFGYLYAASKGADYIFETDDDNIPYNNAEAILDQDIKQIKKINKVYSTTNGWLNIYNYFNGKKIWPRGYPLELINSAEKTLIKNKIINNCGVIQYLANIDPDVDSIYRLTGGSTQTFKKNTVIALDYGTYCPFNSQGTLWSKNYFKYMFFPLGVSDRVTDILRGYIALTCFWHQNSTIKFKSPIIFQKRNKHNLLNDFKQELPLFLNSRVWCNTSLETIKNLNFSENSFFSILKKFVKIKWITSKNITAYNLFKNTLKHY